METRALDSPPKRRMAGGLAIVVSYVLMVAVAAAVFFLIRGYGERISPIQRGSAAPQSFAPQSEILIHVLLALAAVIALGRILGRLFVLVGQPPVIGEVIAGLMLGPSFLGLIVPGASTWLLPPAAAPYLRVIAEVGVILYMFLVGLDLNAELLKNRGHATIIVSHASIVAPFLLGAGLAIFLYPELANDSATFTSFALFIGVAMAITAFPVLARILTDRGLSRSELGAIALACAAIDDVTAWCLLALVVGVAQADIGSALGVGALAVGFIGVIFLVVRPVAGWFARRHLGSEPPAGAVAIVFVALFLSAVATELIGVHALFGAFLLGVVIPHDSAIAQSITRKLTDLVTIVFLPAFFAFTGMRTQITLVSGWDEWLLCGLIIAVATAGKFGGTLVAARLTGLSWRTSAALGTLMNTRGLMELIVLNVGLDLGVISPTLFAMMVIMALVTTIATTPVLRVLVGDVSRRVSE